jgi:hypothetical protein
MCGTRASFRSGYQAYGRVVRQHAGESMTWAHAADGSRALEREITITKKRGLTFCIFQTDCSIVTSVLSRTGVSRVSRFVCKTRSDVSSDFSSRVDKEENLLYCRFGYSVPTNDDVGLQPSHRAARAICAWQNRELDRSHR